MGEGDSDEGTYVESLGVDIKLSIHFRSFHRELIIVRDRHDSIVEERPCDGIHQSHIERR